VDQPCGVEGISFLPHLLELVLRREKLIPWSSSSHPWSCNDASPLFDQPLLFAPPPFNGKSRRRTIAFRNNSLVLMAGLLVLLPVGISLQVLFGY